MIENEVRSIVEAPVIAHLATVSADGGPHSVPLWIDVEGDRLVFLTDPGSAKARNLRRDPRLALSLTAPDNPFQPVVIRGRVVDWLDGDQARALIDRIAVKYTGQPYPPDQRRVIAVVEPEYQHVGIG